MANGGKFILPGNDLKDVFTVADFTEDHKLVRQMMAEFMRSEVYPSSKSIEDKADDFHATKLLMANAAELGITGAEVPEAYGGTDMDKVSSAIIAEGVGGQGSFACTFLAHTGIGTLPIRFFGTADQKAKYLPRLANAEIISAYCLTEQGSGSDANAARTTAERVDGGFRLNGTKIFVTGGHLASIFIVFAKLDEKLTAFIVEKDFEGMSIGNEEHKMGIRGSSTTPVNLNNVFVPVENLLGEEGKGFKIAMNILNLGRFKLGAACLGGARLCLLESTDYAKTRKQFGSSIINYGAIQRKIGLMASMIFGMESVVYRTAGHLNECLEGVDVNSSEAVMKAIEDFAIECSLVKVLCSEAMFKIAEENVRVHGGNGFMQDYPAERHLRDAVINMIFEGTNEINRLVAIGTMLKKVLKNEVPLLAQSKRIFADSMTPSLTMEPDDTVERLSEYLNNAKKAVILLAGSASEKYGLRLSDVSNPQIQILLMNLADCLGIIYLLESSLASLAKNRNEHNENLVRILFTQNLLELDRLIKETLPMCGEGDTLRTLMAMSRRFMKFTPDNLADLYTNVVSSQK